MNLDSQRLNNDPPILGYDFTDTNCPSPARGTIYFEGLVYLSTYMSFVFISLQYMESVLAFIDSRSEAE